MLGGLDDSDNSFEHYYSDDETSDLEQTNTEIEPTMSLKPPKNLNVNSELDMAQEWVEWLELYENYFTANEIEKKSAAIQTANFKAAIGREALKVLNALELTEDEKKELKTLKEKLTAHFAPAKNKTYERYQFHRIRQQQHESFEDFLQKLKEQVKKCSYGHDLANEFVMDQIVVGIHSDETRQRLMTEEEMDLEKAKRICRAAERATKQIHELQNSELPLNASVNVIKKNDKTFNCKRCGNIHGPKSCPAFQKQCEKCKNKGHFAKMCKSKTNAEHNEKKRKPKTKKKGKKVNAVDVEDDSSDSESESDSSTEYQVGSITKQTERSNGNDKWTEKLKVGENEFTAKLDTGAECNVLSEKVAKELKLSVDKTSTKRITTYNNDNIKVIGETKAYCESKNAAHNVVFKIVKEDLAPILGQKMCEKFGFIIRVNQIGSEELAKELYNGLGCCNNFEYEIDFIDNPKFKIIPPRRIPHAVRDKVKAELDKMVEMKVIAPITEPTPAVSPLVIVNKKKKQNTDLYGPN